MYVHICIKIWYLLKYESFIMKHHASSLIFATVSCLIKKVFACYYNCLYKNMWKQSFAWKGIFIQHWKSFYSWPAAEPDVYAYPVFFSGSLSCIFPLIAKFPNVFKFILVQMLINRFHWLHLNWFYHKIAYTELQMQSIHVSNIFKIQVPVKIFDVLSKRHFHESSRWLKRFHVNLIFTDSFN